MKINFFCTEEGVELAELDLPHVPTVGDFITIDEQVKRVKAVNLTIKENKLKSIYVHVRNLRPTDPWK